MGFSAVTIATHVIFWFVAGGVVFRWGQWALHVWQEPDGGRGRLYIILAAVLAFFAGFAHSTFWIGAWMAENDMLLEWLGVEITARDFIRNFWIVTIGRGIFILSGVLAMHGYWRIRYGRSYIVPYLAFLAVVWLAVFTVAS